MTMTPFDNPNWLREQLAKDRIEAEKIPEWQREAIREDLERIHRESNAARGFYPREEK